MKKLFMCLSSAIVLFSCSKEKDIPVRQLPKLIIKKDTTYHDQFLTPPKMQATFASFSVIAEGDMMMQGVMVSFSGLASTDFALIKNVSVAIDIDGQTFTSERKNPTGPTVSFLPAELSLKQGVMYPVRVIGDIGQQLNAVFSTSLKINYTFPGNSDQKVTDVISGQTITVGTGTVQFALDPATPDPRQVAANQQIETVRFIGTALGQKSTLTSTTVNVIHPSLVQSIRLYNDGVMIGETSTFFGTAATIALDKKVIEGTPNTFSVQLQLKAFVNADLFGLNAKTSVVQVKYRTATGENKTASIAIAGNDQYVYKSTAEISTVSLPSTVLQNNMVQEIAKWKIAASSFGPMASKQYALQVSLIDNGTHLDSLSATSLGLKVNGVMVTNVRFTDATGQLIDSIPTGTTTIFFTFTSGIGEVITPSSGATEFTFTGKLKGYNHPIDGDICKTLLIVDDPQTAFKVVNSGVAPDNLTAKLYDSPFASANAVRYNTIISDMSDPFHSLTYGGGTPDALNGSRVSKNIAAQVLTQ